MIYLKVGWEEALEKSWTGHSRFCKKQGCSCLPVPSVTQRIKELNKLIAKGEAIVEDLPDVVETAGEAIVQD